MNNVCAWQEKKNLVYENQKQKQIETKERKKPKKSKETKRNATKDKGGIDEKHKTGKEERERKEHEFVVCINVIKTLFGREENAKTLMCG